MSYRGKSGGTLGIADIRIRSSLFVNNRAARSGGAVYAVSEEPLQIDNCTFVGNEAQDGWDSYIRWGGVTIRNCIYGQSKFSSGGTINRTAMKNCCINAAKLPSAVDSSTSVSDSNGNFAADPGFADAANGDYSLKRDSVCIGRGVLLDWMGRRSKDAAGSRRVCGSLPDLGAFDYYFPVGLKMSVR